MQYILLSFKRMYIYIYNIIIHILYFLKKIIKLPTDKIEINAIQCNDVGI